MSFHRTWSGSSFSKVWQGFNTARRIGMIFWSTWLSANPFLLWETAQDLNVYVMEFLIVAIEPQNLWSCPQHSQLTFKVAASISSIKNIFSKLIYGNNLGISWESNSTEQSRCAPTRGFVDSNSFTARWFIFLSQIWMIHRQPGDSFFNQMVCES